ncbi:fumarylacetoacetate hydrolase family protein [Paenibacillus larvae]
MKPVIRNIYCVGRNYQLHAEELGNAVPEKPMIFTKPSHAVAWMDGDTHMLPGGKGEIHYEAELVIRIGSGYEPGKKAEDLIESVALGIDYTLREVQNKLKEKGHPWLEAKGFLGSAGLTDFHVFEGIHKLTDETFSLQINEKTVQKGNVADMIFGLDAIVSYIGTHFGLNEGDIIYTGTPAGVGTVRHGDELALLWGEQLWGTCTLHLRKY